MNTNTSTIIESVARECANSAIDQGLTPAHLTEGWELDHGDRDALIEVAGRNLTPEEWALAKLAFEERIVESRGDQVSLVVDGEVNAVEWWENIRERTDCPNPDFEQWLLDPLSISYATFRTEAETLIDWCKKIQGWDGGDPIVLVE